MSDNEKQTTIVLPEHRAPRPGLVLARMERTTPPEVMLDEEQDAIAVQTMMLEVARMLVVLPPSKTLGLVLSYLILQCETNPELVRRVMGEPIMREGLRGESLLTYLKRICH
jgi:hypothetical protein